MTNHMTVTLPNQDLRHKTWDTNWTHPALHHKGAITRDENLLCKHSVPHETRVFDPKELKLRGLRVARPHFQAQDMVHVVLPVSG